MSADRDTNDAAVVREILAGETARFSEVVLRHDERVRRVIRRDVADADSIEELVQQTFYLAFRRLGQLSEPGRLGAWLGTIARHAVIEHHRRRAAKTISVDPRALDQPAGARPDPWIWAEVDLLPPPFRVVLTLRYRGGLSYAEISRRLELPVSTIRGRIHEARRALRRRLDEEGTDR